MENKKNNGLIVAFIILLIVAVLSIGGTIYFYYKSLNVNNKEDSTQNCISESGLNEENNNNGLDKLKQIVPFKEYDELGMLTYLEKYYLNYLPNKNQSFAVKDLSDEDISMVSWLYIYNYTEYNNRSIAKYRVDNFLNEYFDLHNYSLKDLKNEDNYSFGLKENNNQYEISIPIGEWMLPVYRAKSITYEESSKEIKINFYKRSNDLSFITEKEGIAIFKITKTEPVAVITLLRVEYK